MRHCAREAFDRFRIVVHTATATGNPFGRGDKSPLVCATKERRDDGTDREHDLILVLPT